MGRLHTATHPDLQDKPPALPTRLRDWAKAAKGACEVLALEKPSRKSKMAAALDIEALCAVEVPWLIQTLESLQSPRVMSHGDFNVRAKTLLISSSS
jgi:hypothetical protein